MEKKVCSAPMAQILERLEAFGEFEKGPCLFPGPFELKSPLLLPRVLPSFMKKLRDQSYTEISRHPIFFWDYNAKLSDFGLAKDAPEGDKTHISTRVMGTYGYAAPEYVMTGHLTSKSDLYSFGVVLLETLTGRRSMDKNRPNGQHDLVEWAKPYLKDRKRLHRLIDRRLEGHFSMEDAQKAAQLAAYCLRCDPRSRPGMSEVVEALKPLRDLKDMANSSFFYQAMQADRARTNPNVKSPHQMQGGLIIRNGWAVRSLSIPHAPRGTSLYNYPRQSPKLNVKLQ